MTPDLPIDESDAKRADRLRAMNELIRERRNEFEGTQVQMHAIMCECIDPNCASMLQLSDADLQAARSDPTWFVVHPAHVADATVVATERSHSIVLLPS